MESVVDDKKITEILLAENYITSDDVRAAKKIIEKTHSTYVDYFLSERIITKDLLGQSISEFFKVSYVNLKKEKIDDEVFNKIPELVARSRGVIAYSETPEFVKVGMINPKDLEVIHIIEKRFGKKVKPYYTTVQDLEDAFLSYKVGVKDEFKSVLNKLGDKNLSRERRDEVIVEMVDILLQYGYQSGASDIHVEPYEKKITIRFRIDGIMHDVLDMPKELLDFIISRIKILSKMRTDVHRSAQDGKITYKIGNERIDIRVSIVPVVYGENIVMRLLNTKQRNITLSSLGMTGEALERVKLGTKKTHGMILSTGPTGSGKTTSLYAILKILNRREVNISTIEDPVEYDIDGISQIQVNPKTDLTFAKGLRAIVRQDPDIIMVGEIRDEETASIAVNSALTGHLVLSTLHTNDAATALPRLLDMKIESFLVASTVNVVIGQRLVRKICTKCRASYELTEEEKDIIEITPGLKKIFQKRFGNKMQNIRLYKGSGCKVCNFTGYEGRIGIFEVLEVNEEIRNAILLKASKDVLEKIAIKNGMTTMMEDGAEKVFNGITSFSEVMRVSRM